ncbi:transcriptional repressor, partial [Vibrio parahaemolyticus]|nr:transcriptional repressor [Vibrio parahaemolyticus]
VDEIYEQLSKEILTLSKTTVYNTLKLFIEKGIVKAINIEGNELRFEAQRGFHGHFKCRECGNIYDIPMNEKEITSVLEGFNIEDMQVLVSGICPDCE